MDDSLAGLRNNCPVMTLLCDWNEFVDELLKSCQSGKFGATCSLPAEFVAHLFHAL